MSTTPQPNNIQVVMPQGMNPPVMISSALASAANNDIIEIGGMKYQKINMNGKPMLVPASMQTQQQQYLITKSGLQTTTGQPVSQLKVQPPAAPPKPKSVFDKSDPDPLLPVGSWEMLDIIKYEVAQHKPDNTFWTGLCNVNKKAEVSSVTKFLFDIGSDIVKQSAYTQITQVQDKKKEAGKLNEQEEQNLVRMKKVVSELDNKLLYMKMDLLECEGCGFKTESKNVLYFHKEHPHMVPNFDSYGTMKCSHCDYETKEATDYSYHMEAEHSMTGRVYSKPAFWQCTICYFEHNQKNKLTQHKLRCFKHFKPILNQAPHHTDVNFLMKNTFYKFQIKRTLPSFPNVNQYSNVAPKQSVHDTRTINRTTVAQHSNKTMPNILSAKSITNMRFPNASSAVTALNQIITSKSNAATLQYSTTIGGTIGGTRFMQVPVRPANTTAQHRPGILNFDFSFNKTQIHININIYSCAVNFILK